MNSFYSKDKSGSKYMISTYTFNFGPKSDSQGGPRWPLPTPDDYYQPFLQ